MIKSVLANIVIIITYVCLVIIAFSPSLYAAWMYLISRKIPLKNKGLLRIALSTFCINAIIVYFLAHLAFDYFLTARIAAVDKLAADTIRNAITSQHAFFSKHGRYYSIGPVKGPYSDQYGLRVEKDVILYAEPHWDKTSQTETFQVYALHAWGKSLLFSTKNGDVEEIIPDSELSRQMRSKLINSVK